MRYGRLVGAFSAIVKNDGSFATLLYTYTYHLTSARTPPKAKEISTTMPGFLRGGGWQPGARRGARGGGRARPRQGQRHRRQRGVGAEQARIVTQRLSGILEQ